MEGTPPASEKPGERRLALVCHTWGHASTFYSWVFMKQYLLRRIEQCGTPTLDPNEKLYIVKAGKPDDAGGPDRWKMGGPLVPDLDTAMQHYPHSLVKLEGSVKSNIHTFLAQHPIDIMVIPAHWPSSVLSNVPGFTSSVSDWVKQNVFCPFIITRREIVVNTRMKISASMPTASSPPATGAGGSPQDMLERTATAMPLRLTAAQSGRRVAIAYNSFAVGRGLMQFAKEKVLTHADTVYICHVFSNHSPVMKETLKIMRVMTLQKADSMSDEVTRDNSIQFGAAELAGYDVQLNVTLQGDAKSAITTFCESEGIELLIIGSRSGSRMRKRLSGGGVSSHLIDNASCPCLVVPYKWMGVDDGGTAEGTAEDEAGSPIAPPAVGAAAAWAGSPSSPPAEGGAAGEAGVADAAVQTEGSALPPQAAAVADTVAAAGIAGGAHSTPSDLLAALQKQIEEKDRTIAELRQQVQQLRLAAAEREASDTHDPAQAGHAF